MVAARLRLSSLIYLEGDLDVHRHRHGLSFAGSGLEAVLLHCLHRFLIQSHARTAQHVHVGRVAFASTHRFTNTTPAIFALRAASE